MDDTKFLDKYFNDENAKKWFFRKRQMQLEDLDTIEKLKKDYFKKYEKEAKKNIDIKRENRKILKKWFNNFTKDKEVEKLLDKVSIFWGSKKFEKKNINIILYKKYKKTMSGMSASATKGIESKLISISFNKKIDIHDKSQKITFLSTFFHELSHLIQYQDNNNLVNLFKKEFKKRNLNLNEQDVWWDSILEATNSSIAHFNLSLFIEEYYGVKELRVVSEQKWKIISPKSIKGKSLYLPVAYKILPETRKYFNEGKKIDEKYIKKVFDFYEEFRDKLKK